MDGYLGRVHSVVNKLPVVCLAEEGLQWMEQKKLLSSPTLAHFIGLNEKALNAILQLVSRVVALHFAYPKLSPMFSFANASVGVIHISLGVAQRFKTDSTEINREDWEKIALNIHKGVSHLLVAAYDFGIGFVVRKKYGDLISVLAFGAMPMTTFVWHKYCYKKTEDPQAVAAKKIFNAIKVVFQKPAQEVQVVNQKPKPAPDHIDDEHQKNVAESDSEEAEQLNDDKGTALERVINLMKENDPKLSEALTILRDTELFQQAYPEAQYELKANILSDIEDKLSDEQLKKIAEVIVPIPLAPPASIGKRKITPSYLGSDCLIYDVARKITLELIPKNVKTAAGTWQDALPDFGL
jgi:hypothetical protein